MPPRAMAVPDAVIVGALRNGDQAVFSDVVDAYSAGLMKVAGTFVRDRAVAEEVVQETWLSVLRGIDRFEERSSLKTWIYQILINTAKTRAKREARSIPFSAAVPADEPSVDPDRFLGPDHRHAGAWIMGPSDWQLPEDELVRGETRNVILGAIEQLPDVQRAVITLRDVEGFPPEEVCTALGISNGNQRVLLHRARSRVRTAIEAHLGAVEVNTWVLENA